MSHTWSAQFFCENQSGGLPGSPNCFMDLETDTQFWSPDLTTDDASPSCSFSVQVSMGVDLSFRRCCTPVAPAGIGGVAIVTEEFRETDANTICCFCVFALAAVVSCREKPIIRMMAGTEQFQANPKVVV